MTTVTELKAKAKARYIKGYSTMKKAELEKALSQPPPKPPRTKSKAEQAKNPVKKVQAPAKKAPAKKAPAKKAPAKIFSAKFGEGRVPTKKEYMEAQKNKSLTKWKFINPPYEYAEFVDEWNKLGLAPAPAKGGFKIAVSRITNSQNGADYIVSLSRTGKITNPRKDGKNWVFTGHDDANVSISMSGLKRELQEVLKGESSFGYEVNKLAYLTQRSPSLKLQESKKFLVSKYPALVGKPAEFGAYSSQRRVDVADYTIHGIGLNIQPFITKKGKGIIGRAPLDLYKFDQTAEEAPAPKKAPAKKAPAKKAPVKTDLLSAAQAKKQIQTPEDSELVSEYIATLSEDMSAAKAERTFNTRSNRAKRDFFKENSKKKLTKKQWEALWKEFSEDLDYDNYM